MRPPALEAAAAPPVAAPRGAGQAGAPAAPPPPPAPAPAAPKPAARGSNKLVLILIGVSLLVIAAVGGACLDARPLGRARRQRSVPANEIAAGRAGRPGNAAGHHRPRRILAGGGDQRRGGFRQRPRRAFGRCAHHRPGQCGARPSTPTPRTASWWRVRIAGGLVGYMERARIRVRRAGRGAVARPGRAGGAARGRGRSVRPDAPDAFQVTPPRAPAAAPAEAGRAAAQRGECRNPARLLQHGRRSRARPECRRVGLGGRRRRY